VNGIDVAKKDILDRIKRSSFFFWGIFLNISYLGNGWNEWMSSNGITVLHFDLTKTKECSSFGGGISTGWWKKNRIKNLMRREVFFYFVHFCLWLIFG